MQEVASVAREAEEIFEGVAGGAVERIAQQGVADGCEMDSDLVGATTMQAYFECDGVGGAEKDFREGPRGLAVRAGGPDGADEGFGTRPMGVRMS